MTDAIFGGPIYKETCDNLTISRKFLCKLGPWVLIERQTYRQKRYRCINFKIRNVAKYLTLTLPWRIFYIRASLRIRPTNIVHWARVIDHDCQGLTVQCGQWHRVYTSSLTDMVLQSSVHYDRYSWRAQWTRVLRWCSTDKGQPHITRQWNIDM